MAVYADRIELDGRSVEFSLLKAFNVNQNVLHVKYVTPDGEPVEEYFRYDTFLLSTATKTLSEVKAFVDGKQSNVKSDAIAEAGSAALAKRVEVLFSGAAKAVVIVHSGSLSFPPFCPACLGEAETLATLHVGTFTQRGFWLVPVCVSHRDLSKSLRVLEFSSLKSGIKIQCENGEYASRFARQNEEFAESPWKTVAAKNALSLRLRDGTRFVRYSYAVGAVLFGYNGVSSAVPVRSYSDAVFWGTYYTIGSLGLGWWVFPWGPFLILGSTLRNLRGGYDVTPVAKLAAEGRPLSAFGVET